MWICPETAVCRFSWLSLSVNKKKDSYCCWPFSKALVSQQGSLVTGQHWPTAFSFIYRVYIEFHRMQSFSWTSQGFEVSLEVLDAWWPFDHSHLSLSSSVVKYAIDGYDYLDTCEVSSHYTFLFCSLSWKAKGKFAEWKCFNQALGQSDGRWYLEALSCSASALPSDFHTLTKC